ncbi:MAG: epoxyqueuosine reductase [Promethearchaeota archaeon]
MEEEIKKSIDYFIKKYNKKKEIKKKWREPIIAFANAKDPFFLKLKEIVDKNHKLPFELLKKAKTVITYFIPFNDKIVLSNSTGKIASKDWAIAYIETNKLISELNQFLLKILKKKNFVSVKIAPTHIFEKEKLVSYWSHKHVAYIAGLGKFGLHKMLITEKGCCGRIGSLITSAEITATKRSEDEYCLFYHNESCKQCIIKCPINALDINSFDRNKCYNICLDNAKRYSLLGISDVCGKCACGVPCSLKNPCK